MCYTQHWMAFSHLGTSRMSQDRVNRVFSFLGWLGRVWNVILLVVAVCMVLFLLSLAFRYPGSLGGILFGMGVFIVIGVMCISDLRKSRE